MLSGKKFIQIKILSILLISRNLNKEGKSIYYWHLVNYFIQNENIYWKSSLTYTEVDCNLFRGKDHVFNYYSEFMGEGEILGDHNPPNEWVSPEPNTLRYLSYNEVCDQ